jgi:heme/copper-type cytochrome/quinol oxidase subunit 3
VNEPDVHASTIETPFGPRPRLDVRHLPGAAMDVRHPVWWGNTLFLAIESMTVALLLVAYFYLRKNFPHWPPPRGDLAPALFDPVPDLKYSTLDLAVQLGSLVPVIAFDRAARRQAKRYDAAEQRPDRDVVMPGTDSRRQRAPFLRALGLATLLTVVAVVLRFYEFPGLKFSWDANAYGSVVWALLGLHLLYLLVSFAEMALLVSWVWMRGLSDKLAIDATLAAGSWYWVVAVWVILYLVVYVSPRLG